MPNTNTHGLVDINHQQVNENPQLYQQQWLDRWFEVVSGCPKDDFDKIQVIQKQLQQLGMIEQKAFSRLNENLNRPLQQMMHAANQGGVITALLKQLHSYIGKIKPPKQTIWARFLNHFRLLFSWRETAFELWLDDYPENEEAVQQIIKKLEHEQRRLTAENKTIAAEKAQFIDVVQQMEHAFDLLSALQSTWQQDQLALTHHELIEAEFFPDLQQRIIELQQQLLIARQTMMSLDLFIQQNTEQIKGIEHATETTLPVLKVTASLNLLQNQRTTISEQAKIKPAKISQARVVVEDALNLIDQVRNKQDAESNFTSNSD